MINGRISLKKTYQMCYICVSGLFNSGRMALFRKIMPWTMLSAKIKSIVESWETLIQLRKVKQLKLMEKAWAQASNLH